MQKRPFMITVLVILLAQPIVVGVSMPFSFGLKEPSRILAQVAGSRIDPVDLTNHVPILIDGTDDFVSQGWPGSGTPSDPYIIAGLNITQDYVDGSINIKNTNASFVVRDCYIYQGLSEYAIYLVNTTDALFEYTTTETPKGGVLCNNANNTVFDHSVIAAGNTYAFNVQYSNNCEYHYNDISTNYRIYYGYYSQYIVSSHNTYDGHPSWYSVLMTYCNGSSYSYDTWLEGYTLNMMTGYDISFTDVVIDNAGGFQLTVGNGLEFLRSSITTNDFSGIDVFQVPNIVIQDTTIQSVSGDGINIGNSDNVSITNTVVDDTIGYGMYIDNCDNIYISGVDISNTNFPGVDIQDSDNITLDEIDVMNTGGSGFHITSCNNGTLSNVNIEEAAGHGIDINTGANWTITDNTFMNIVSTGIDFTSGVNLVLKRNSLSYTGNGFVISNAVNATITDNHFTETTGTGIDIASSFHPIITSNTFDVSQRGLSLSSSNNATIEGNDINDNEIHGIYLDNCDYAEILDNMITGGHEGGITIGGCLDAKIVGNTMVDSGIVASGSGPLAEFIHEVEDNTVNGLPIYYNPGASGENIVASNYGQVLLVNNTWMDVHDGTFGLATMPVELGYSSNCELWNLDFTGNFIGIGMLYSVNLTIHDITHNGGAGTSGIAALSTQNVTIQDAEFTGNIDALGAIWGIGVDGLYVVDSLFDGNDMGIVLNVGTDVLISNNQFLNTAEDAIYISSSSSEYLRVINNDILNATYGIYSDNADNWTIMDNTIMYCSTYGIYFAGDGADDGNITLNTIENNANGIRISLGDTGTITNNTIRWNSGYGIYLDLSSSTEVYYNVFAMNLIENGHDTVANTWDDASVLGNWWDDYTPPGVYNVPGSGGAVDNYPMQYAPTEPIISNPQDVYYAEGSVGNEILWYALDDSLKEWAVTIDGDPWDSDAWNFDNITVNIDGLSYGTYTVVVTLWDVDLNSVTDTVILHVFDGTHPTISNTPNTVAFTTGTGQTLSWEVSDLHPDTYTAYLDGEEWDTGSWSNGVLEINIDGMDEGEHSLLMEIADIDGNIAFDPVLIRVIVDTDDPVIDSPADITYILGETGNAIVWTATDANPDSYEITAPGGGMTELGIASGNWYGARVTLNVDGLGNGTHSFTLTVFDGAGNSASDTVVVTVMLPTPEEPEPLPPLDLGMIILVLGVIGAVAVVIIVIYAVKKKRTPY
ncbi:MAG: right-handed parallel beta-helix repeat-containing protein [Candidatus Thorarchaeota archaeon]